MTSLISTLLQGLNPGKSRFSFPYDSTNGVNKWFYLFALAAILFLIVGVRKAFWDDKEWREKHFGKWLSKKKVNQK